MINKNLGYYRCNQVDFSSKVDALLYSKIVGQSVEWMFHQDVFDAYPWHIEPMETLDQLYDRRARELREKYDYIILSFSGGADTNNILESFIRQRLHIDEIVINHMTEATQKFTVVDRSVKNSWNFAAEHQLQGKPRLQYIHTHLPNTKITELDVSHSVLGSLKQFNDADWVLGRNDHLSVGQLFRYNYFHFGQIKKNFDLGKQVAIIVGLDKPRTFIKDNMFYLKFIDTVANITTINDFNQDYTNVTTELFYWSPSCADMICKQAHVIKHWLEATPQRQKFWDTPSFSTVRLYHERWLRNLIYTTWDNSWFQTDKATDWWNTEFDTWFRINPEFSKDFQAWKNGIEFLAEQLPNLIRRNKQGQADSLLQFFSVYKIGTMN